MKLAITQEDMRRIELLAARAERDRASLAAVESDVADVLQYTKEERKEVGIPLDALNDLVWTGRPVATVLDLLGVKVTP